MNRRNAIQSGMILFVFACNSAVADSPRGEDKMADRMVGMYVHQHWPYNHPYAARTWTVEDWRGYAGGLKKIGYNTIMIWPMLEIMPDPLTPSDRSSLSKIGNVIDVLHDELGMRVWIVICPNVGVNSAEARKATFEKRHFFYCDTRVNPGDAAALEKLVKWREKLMKPLAKIDGIAIIDSDPGGYPRSTNDEFVNLLGEHRKMLDRVRPGIELIYWMHAGWEAYARYYETGKLVLANDAEHQDAVDRLIKLNPAPWGIANGLPYAEKRGIAAKVISFNYGRIEGEPSFPMTNFGGTSAYDGGKSPGPRGVMGNSQTHCVQLPNTFAFARGAQGLPLAAADYIRFANDLIPGHGPAIVDAWKALAGKDSAAMLKSADAMRDLSALKPAAGPLKGLLFNDPARFCSDLVHMLQMRAALEEFIAATDSGRPVKEPFRKFVQTSEKWQQVHGFQNMWWDGRMYNALVKLNSPSLKPVLEIRFDLTGTYDEARPAFHDVQANLARIETYTVDMLAAMKAALKEMH